MRDGGRLNLTELMNAIPAYARDSINNTSNIHFHDIINTFYLSKSYDFLVGLIKVIKAPIQLPLKLTFDFIFQFINACRIIPWIINNELNKLTGIEFYDGESVGSQILEHSRIVKETFSIEEDVNELTEIILSLTNSIDSLTNLVSILQNLPKRIDEKYIKGLEYLKECFIIFKDFLQSIADMPGVREIIVIITNIGKFIGDIWKTL